MKAIEVTATIDEKGHLNLDQTLPVTTPQRVRVIVLMSDRDDPTARDIIKSDNLGERIKNRFNGLQDVNIPVIERDEIRSIPNFE
ncbi:hypothetical protein ACN4EE_08165 [Geminocystis sp. CENA526]|uniref:hypothetical protein n=1 Tax=Geminocystis sp. CENA526 TaxID=1355871 RepID=UPI003D6E2CAD